MVNKQSVDLAVRFVADSVNLRLEQPMRGWFGEYDVLMCRANLISVTGTRGQLRCRIGGHCCCRLRHNRNLSSYPRPNHTELLRTMVKSHQKLKRTGAPCS